MLDKLMNLRRSPIAIIGLLILLLGVSTASAQSRLEAARAKERELDRAAAQVDPSSRDADRIYREAANATRERQRAEQLEAMRTKERELDRTAAGVGPSSRDADRIYRGAANATRERQRAEQYDKERANRPNPAQVPSVRERYGDHNSFFKEKEYHPKP